VPPVRVPASARTFAGFRTWRESDDCPQQAKLSYLDGAIFIEMLEHDFGVFLPRGTTTLKGFRKWATSDSFPERGRISYLDGEVWIDMSPEEIETHLKVKEAITRTTGNINEELDLGELFPDGALLVDDAANLSTEPDAMLVKWRTYRAKKVTLIPRRGKPCQFMEVHGRPDWVLEIISRSSIAKDTKELAELYHQAGIPEYWLINAMEDEISFQILMRRRFGYEPVRPQGGWHKSRVFGRSFRLERRRNRLGRWQYKLHVRPAAGANA
jgi:Uma2 family endonuclease